MEDASCRTCQRVKIEKCLSYCSLDVQSNVIDRYMGVAGMSARTGFRLKQIT